MINITPQQLRQAANIQEKIQSLQEELSQLLGASGRPQQSTEKKWKMSAAGKARIAAAARARWAKIKGTKVTAKAVQKPKIQRSAAWRAAISAAAKGQVGQG